MVATNDDLLKELISIKKLLKGQYTDKNKAIEEMQGSD